MRRLAAAVVAVPLAVASGLFALVALYLGVARCDESCDSSGRWWHDYDAWQWKLFFVLAAVGVAAAVTVLVAAALARTRLGAGALAAWTLTAGAFLTLLGEGGYRRHTAAGWSGIAILTLLGVVSIALTAGRAPDGSRPASE